MPSRHDPICFSPRGRAFWVAVSVLLGGQLVALWMLCSQQVRLAEARHASGRVEAQAVADCMRSLPNATLIGCMQRVAPADPQAVAASGQPAQPPENTAYR